MTRNLFLLALSSVWLLVPAPHARADRLKMAREATEFLMKQFGKEAAQEGAEKLTARIAGAAARYGDNVVNEAVRKAGPRALTLAEEAGEHGPQVMRLLARHGDDAARVLSRPQNLALVARHGDDAAEALIRHPAAGPLIEAHGSKAVQALRAIEPQNGRRLAILAQGGDLARIGRTEELLEVIAKYSNRAAAFVWENKGALAVTACLTAFLMDPAPYLDGTKELAKHVTHTVADAAVKPVAEVPAQMTKEMAKEVAKGTNWTLIFITVLAIVGALLAGRGWLRHHRSKACGPVLPCLLLAAVSLPAFGQGDTTERDIMIGVRKVQLEKEAKADILRGMDRATVERRLRRELVLIDVPEADKFTKDYGDLAVNVLRRCTPDTARELVKLAEGLELPAGNVQPLLEVINQPGHGEKVAAWVVRNPERIREPAAFRRFCASPLEYVFDLRSLEVDSRKPIEQPKKEALALSEGMGLLIPLGLVVVAGIWWARRRKAGRAGAV